MSVKNYIDNIKDEGTKEVLQILLERIADLEQMVEKLISDVKNINKQL